MKALDLTGQRFGRLVVVKEAEPIRFKPSNKTKRRWLCRCDCGGTVITTTGSLRSGATKSCGCYCKERQKENGRKKRTHGLSGSHIYNIWRGMKKRCNNPKNTAFHNYGGRGITICDEWNNSFEVFADWAFCHGYKEGLSIERIDVNEGYNPQNCCWIPRNEQGKNRRITRRFTDISGNEMYVIDVAKQNSIPINVVHNRIRNGWSTERALNTPLIKNENRGKTVQQCSIDEHSVLKEFASVNDAGRALNLSAQAIGKRCRTGGGVFAGYYWKYRDKVPVYVKYYSHDINLSSPEFIDSFDLACSKDISVLKGCCTDIPLGIALCFPKGYSATITPLNSAFAKYKIILNDGVTIIKNPDLSNEWQARFYAAEDTFIPAGARVCECRILKDVNEEVTITEEYLFEKNPDNVGV